ncbi:hypothetical protein MLD38_027798 [Melastoma candidum]|uniref:Uncharacterized protein n=1 Tax=Melastoma candidum TaxID=119954 RepID=A0ACB9P2W5_9MYRT|nr:hypothetical protein MLD38_027798 [Melastoma candidum]
MTCCCLQGLFTAGTDTVTARVEWAMTEPVRNPESMKRVREELDRYVGPCATKVNQLPGLPYLQACVKETLRLHPPATLLIIRAAGRDPKVSEDLSLFKLTFRFQEQPF